MKKSKATKRALLSSVLALVLCFTMLLGTTYAWFTDSVSSTGNKIQSGTLKLKLEEKIAAGENGWKDISDLTDPLFNYTRWEPGYTDYTVLRLTNDGTLALKWEAKLVNSQALGILADVIDVYVTEFANATVELPADAAAAMAWDYKGTLKQFFEGFADVTKGNLTAGESACLGIALHMREEAGNEYQNQDLGTFDLVIFASQNTVEADGFGNTQYDEDADQLKKVSTAAEFQAALQLGGTIVLEDDIVLTGSYTEITKDTVLDLNGHSIVAERIHNGTYASTSAVLSVLGCNVTIKGNGTIQNTHPKVSSNTFAIYMSEEGGLPDAKLTIEDGTFIGGGQCIYVGSGDLVVNGGTFSCANPDRAQPDKYWPNGPSAMYDPKLLNAYDKSYPDKATIVVNGGTFINEDPSNVVEGPQWADRYNISHLAPGKKIERQDQANGDAWFVVVDDTSTP